MVVPKRERLREFYRRLMAAPGATSCEEALDQLSRILNAVEDELTDIANDPGNWEHDDRIYPPQSDNMHAVPAHPNVKRFRSVRHNIYVGANGSIEIISSADGTVELRKPGADGRDVWELDPT